MEFFVLQWIKFKFFLWPNYQLEDLACLNCYYFGASNGSHFSNSSHLLFKDTYVSMIEN